ncbi:MAG: DUF2225 domain-containing protein [Asgard group archaeon]|nr:DUF2225 domain-containing protein [Asgard group archaeon]
MPLLYDELFTCPNCSIIFQSKVLGGFNTFGKHYSDFYIGSQEDPQPILYEINICPKCGFSGFTIDLKSFSVDIELVQLAIEKVANFTGKKPSEFKAGDGYLVIANYLHNLNIEEKIGYYLKATYAYRELEDSMLESTRLEIINLIDEVLEKKKFVIQTKEFYLYLIGELYRLVGKTSESLMYFEKSLKIANKKSLISKLVEHQLKNPMEVLPQDFLRT